MKQIHELSSCTLILFSSLLMFNFISINDNIHCSISEHEEINSETGHLLHYSKPSAPKSRKNQKYSDPM